MIESGIRVWAPRAARVDLVVGDDAFAMTPEAEGWHRSTRAVLPPEDYGFSIDGGPTRPDPRSHQQPDGVHGRSRVVDHDAFPWADAGWHGVHLPSCAIYELHVGTFSEGGTFDGVIEHLDHLVDLGVGALELMPVAGFDGARGWGYDGVALWAVHEPYGGPDGLKRLVDAAHARGLGVVLDVVYNHLGPSGNYLGQLGPYFDDRHQTPWGAAVNLDGPDSGPVRAFILDNARHWFERYHVDGLRLDATHALIDESAIHLLAELADDVHALADHLGRPLWLIAESDRNDPRTVTSRDAGGLGLHAQWSDDLHHAVHALLTGERDGYYADFGSVAALAKALRDMFVLDGGWSQSRRRVVGAPVGDLPRDRFVVCSQNHDQVGNRASGDRLRHVVDPAALRVAAALVLLAPGIPLLFMGEEWGASTPFPYFADERDPKLDDAVREGRRREFEAFGWGPEDVPDPLDPETFASAVLRWDEITEPGHGPLLEWYRSLLSLRRARPDLCDPRPERVSVTFDEDERWLVLTRGATDVVVNLASETVTIPLPTHPHRELLLSSCGRVDLDVACVTLPGISAIVAARDD
ncbi:MAG: maltooligosyltrehalose trehalohydrolase [Acidimicrobiaceae bacterium]